MKGLVLRSVSILALCLFLVALLSCARDQQLVAITVQPDTENFGAADPTLNVQLKALGHYIHPPVTKDITGQVNWASNTPEVAIVSPTGLLFPGGFSCGNSLISATVRTNNSVGNRSSSGAIIIGSMTANVACSGSGGVGSGGGGSGSSTLTVDFSGVGSGTIASTPAGLGCASACTGTFATGTAITLNATPNSGSTFSSWVGCDSVLGQACNLVLNSNRVVTVTFN